VQTLVERQSIPSTTTLFSALWVAWRHRFSAAGYAFALLALVAGTPFLCAFLLTESVRSGGDVRALLLGPRQHDR
jgi:hypothetical protein